MRTGCSSGGQRGSTPSASLYGDETGEMSVSNPLTDNTKCGQVRRSDDRKYVAG